MLFNRLKIRAGSLLLTAIFAASSTITFAQQETFTLDPGQTKINFTLGDVLHTVHGEFLLKRGSIVFDKATGKASGELVVDSTSGDSGNKSRDKKMHKEILESQKYPEIIFTPQHFQGALNEQGKSHLVVDGLFNIHGQSHPMTLTIDTDIEHGNASAVTSFAVPYVKWGLKNPSNFILRVSDRVDITINAVARLAPVSNAMKQK